MMMMMIYSFNNIMKNGADYQMVKKSSLWLFLQKILLEFIKKKERKNEKQKFIKNHALKLTGYAVFNFYNNY